MAASDVPNVIAGSVDADVDEMGTQSGGVEENGPGVGPGKTVTSADEIVVSMGGVVAVSVDDRVDADVADDRVGVMHGGRCVDTGGVTVASLLLGVGRNVIGPD
jgi:hypothetical protein